MKAYKKLINNIFNPNAVTVLGKAGFARYMAAIISGFTEIARNGDLKPVDRSMGRTAISEFNIRGRLVKFDVGYADSIIKDGTYAFGIIREIYIRECYFAGHPSVERLMNAKVVFDLGANRGAFSSIFASGADFIVAVECNSVFIPVLEHNFRINGARRYAIETVFVGSGGKLNVTGKITSINELLAKYQVPNIDFLKIDIEGSEFELFRGSSDWLTSVEAISMEVHRSFGEVKDITSALRRRGFSLRMANADLGFVNEEAKADFIYAYRS